MTDATVSLSVPPTSAGSATGTGVSGAGAAPSDASHLLVPRSSVSFFTDAAPKLHEYVRALQKENDQLRAQNDQLRADTEILDGISDFLREMSKTDLNYKQFMEAKTAEVEAHKKKAAQPPMTAPKELPPVVTKQPYTATPSASASASTTTPAAAAAADTSNPVISASKAAPSAAAAAASPASLIGPAKSAPAKAASTGGMFSGMAGGFFGSKPTQPAKPTVKKNAVDPAATSARATPAVTPAPAATSTASSTSVSSTPLSPPQPSLPDLSVPAPDSPPVGDASPRTGHVRPKKAAPAQKRPPTKPAGEGAEYLFTPLPSGSASLRHVRPYTHEYHVFAKKRWLGRRLVDVLVSDFKLSGDDTGEDGEDEPASEGEEGGADANNTNAIAASPDAHYRAAIAAGKITVNGASVAPEYILRDRDHIIHAVHKHEPPVPSRQAAIAILADTPDYVVVSKPGGIPVHESGKYRHNSLLGILWNQSPFERVALYPVHRLDKLTSGVVILAKNKETAAKIGAKMKFVEATEGEETTTNTGDAQQHNTHQQNNSTPASAAAPTPAPAAAGKSTVKLYLARVDGCFPSASALSTKGFSKLGDAPSSSPSSVGRLPAAWSSPASLPMFDSKSGSTDQFHLAAPIQTVSLRQGIHAVSFELGKTSRTAFTRMSYDPVSDTSVVLAQPLTGRTHQIRLHLEYLSHPIVNDPVYGRIGGTTFEGCAFQTPAVNPFTKLDGCQECAKDMYYNPTLDHGRYYPSEIWLHAWAYTFDIGSSEEELTFQTPQPDWSTPEFEVQSQGARVKTSSRARDKNNNNNSTHSSSPSSAPSTASSSPPVVAGTSPSSLSIRPVLPTDVGSIHSIYSHWVRSGCGTFEETPPTLADMSRRVNDLCEAGMPFLVATVKEGGEERVVGYAYAGPFRTRSAYRYTLEDSIYVHPDWTVGVRRCGVGSTLLGELLRVCTELGYVEMVALIGDSLNAGSIGLHHRFAFRRSGVMSEVGRKFNRWLDVVIMQRTLNQKVKHEPTEEPKRFNRDTYRYTPTHNTKRTGLEATTQ